MKTISVLLLFLSISAPLLARADDESDDSIDSYVWVPDNSDGTCQNSAGAGADFADLYNSVADVSEITAGYGAMPSDSKLSQASAFQMEDIPIPSGTGALQLAADDFRQLSSVTDRSGNVPYLVRQPIGTHTYTGETLYGNRVYVGPPGASNLGQLSPVGL